MVFNLEYILRKHDISLKGKKNLKRKTRKKEHKKYIILIESYKITLFLYAYTNT